jgi:hypothetical protein
MGPPHAIRHSRESGNPEARSRVLDPRFCGGDDKWLAILRSFRSNRVTTFSEISLLRRSPMRYPR